MGDWAATVFLDPDSDEPVYLQIAHAVMREIHRGRFRLGEALPGYRTLAEQLGVSRNTVMAAYAELRKEGWLTSRPGEGSAVAEQLPSQLPSWGRRDGPAAKPSPATMGFDLAGEAPRAIDAPRRSPLEVASGVPDPRLLPGAALARCYRRALTIGRGNAHAAEDPQGHPRLREALAHLLSRVRGIPAKADQVMVTRGSQMALFLLGQALLSPGDAVAVEALGDRSAWEAFARAGARCLPVAVDEGGLRVDELEPLARAGGLRAVLVTPQRQYPTLAVLAADRRAGLLALAGAHRLAVLEVDLDSEFQYEGRPPSPLAAAAPGAVVHVGTLSKIFSPELRLGFVHGPAPLVARLRAARATLDRHGDPVLERAMAELMEDGELQRHVNRMVQVYRPRRDALCAALGRELPGVIATEPPAGGLALWVKVRGGVDVDRWAARALELGVAFQPGRRFAFDGGAVAGIRLGFSNYPEPQLEEVARRLREALEAGSASAK